MAEKILFVCLGNICRSPLGEGVLRSLVAQRLELAERIEVDSAGTSAYHVGEPPDDRMSAVAQSRGVSMEGQRSRQVSDSDFAEFDLILAMDRSNLEDLRSRAPKGCRAEIRLMRSYDPSEGEDVPDPYYGGEDGFQVVFEIVHRSCSALIDELLREVED